MVQVQCCWSFLQVPCHQAYLFVVLLQLVLQAQQVESQ